MKDKELEILLKRYSDLKVEIKKLDEQTIKVNPEKTIYMTCITILDSIDYTIKLHKKSATYIDKFRLIDKLSFIEGRIEYLKYQMSFTNNNKFLL